MRSGFVPKLLIVFLIACLGGCSPKTAKVKQEVKPTEEFFVHRISIEGENLSLIALWYTGDRQNWRKLFISSSAGSLRTLKNGDKVLIPRALVTRSEPMDRAFIKAAHPRPIRRDNRPEKSPEPVEPLIEVVPELVAEPVPTRPSPQELETEFLDSIVK